MKDTAAHRGSKFAAQGRGDRDNRIAQAVECPASRSTTNPQITITTELEQK